ncbi:MAG: hypothetical protein ACLTK0_08285 [Anaerovoracaceae bacterium]
MKKRDFRKAIFPARGKLLRETESPAGGQKENPGGNQNPPVDKKTLGELRAAARQQKLPKEFNSYQANGLNVCRQNSTYASKRAQHLQTKR